MRPGGPQRRIAIVVSPAACGGVSATGRDTFSGRLAKLKGLSVSAARRPKLPTRRSCAAASENSDRLAGLSERLDKLAPVNVAMGLGRMPSIGARIVRACDEQGLLGEQLTVIGTNAMFAYEVQAGVQLESGLIATGDIDLLYDARRRLSLAVTGLATAGLIGLLKKVDESFAPARP